MRLESPSKSKIKLCIAGKNSIAVNALKYALTLFANNEICVIPNHNDNGEDSWQPSLYKFANQSNVKIATLQEVQQIPNVLFLSLEFDKLIKVERFASKRLYNIHFSALPKYKGVFTSITPILNGESESGVTLHTINNGIDTGEIIAQRIFKIGLQDSARDLYFRYLEEGFALFKEKFNVLLNGEFSTYKQSPLQSSYFARTDIDVANIMINLKKTSFEIHNQLRAFIFKEYQLPTIRGVAISQSILSEEYIGRNVFKDKGDCFILSGIDGFKVVAYKEESASFYAIPANNAVSAGGGGQI
ncbi:hypothetical protein LS70_008505 [Helicobacter sp. MIT 11-5569]|uniref:formyltransferase family protein n=1 Tax=Helicobacter sp. MIT 11-5569 TaxID=1548151 RepID=UPI0010FF188F|nr:formyltransferase family protein [Helicobacter sp. MIT 11-5569]TLD81160.1 hypothetical protein LS70_008505 [Helicobacter sp. MIT 11-5569]